VESLNGSEIAPQSLNMNEFFFPGSLSGTSKEDNLYDEMSQDGIIVCHCSSTLYMMSYIAFLQMFHQFMKLQGMKTE